MALTSATSDRPFSGGIAVIGALIYSETRKMLGGGLRKKAA